MKKNFMYTPEGSNPSKKSSTKSRTSNKSSPQNSTDSSKRRGAEFSDDFVRGAYDAWSKIFGRRMDETRFQVFKINYVETRKADTAGDFEGLNEYGDLTPDEFKALVRSGAPISGPPPVFATPTAYPIVDPSGPPSRTKSRRKARGNSVPGSSRRSRAIGIRRFTGGSSRKS